MKGLQHALISRWQVQGFFFILGVLWGG